MSRYINAKTTRGSQEVVYHTAYYMLKAYVKWNLPDVKLAPRTIRPLKEFLIGLMINQFKLWVQSGGSKGPEKSIFLEDQPEVIHISIPLN